MKKALLIFFGIVFVCCIYGYGTNERFSFETWLDNVVKIGDMATIEEITDFWTNESCYYKFPDGEGPPELIVFESYEGENEVLEWLDSMVGFFKRMFYTLEYLAEMFLDIFRNMRLLLPWNSTVTVG